MKSRLSFLIRYVLFWMISFVLYRLLFLFYHYPLTGALPLSEILDIFYHGAALDLSMTGYFSLIPFLLISSSFYLNPELILKLIKYYTLIIIILFSPIVIADLETYLFWGHRLDNSFIKYLSTPKEMMASSLSSPLYALLPLWILLVVIQVILLHRLVMPVLISPGRSLTGTLILALLTAALIIPIRGGFQLSPINESVVYFSSNAYSNNAAINLPWTFFRSFVEDGYQNKNPYDFYSKEEADSIFRSLYPKTNRDSIVLKSRRPNIVFIIWESFTKQIEDTAACPNFIALKKEGLYFENIYANADRSDKGLVSILSGYPALTTWSITTNPAKSVKLPSFTKSLNENGYSSAFIYGGELEFANIKSYLINTGFQNLIGKEDFDPSTWNSKWGAHDEVTFARTLEELNKAKKPAFISLFTLSSHEPFEIPMRPHYNSDNNRSTQFMNSHYYADSCLGAFILQAKQQPYWDNTLFVIIADHGHIFPKHQWNHRDSTEFKIPMLWLGGALNTTGVVEKTGSQTDLTTTLLHQLNLPAEEFIFGKDLLSPESLSFAYYSFNNGFGWISPDGKVLYDHFSGRFSKKSGSNVSNAKKYGKAYLQYSIQNYIDK